MGEALALRFYRKLFESKGFQKGIFPFCRSGGFGNPIERYIKKGSEYYKLNSFITENEDKLFEKISKEEKVLYENILQSRFEQEGISERETFIEGFRLGAQIMLEILTDPDK